MIWTILIKEEPPGNRGFGIETKTNK